MLRPSAAPLVSLLLLSLTASTTSSAIPASSLFARQQSCAAEGFETCGGDFPDYFCCQEGTRCLSLAGDTTALCCPEGSQCEGLAPITCNLNGQDAEKDFRIPLKTTVFDVPLEKCGDNRCCPYGFHCEDGANGKECRMDEDQSKKPTTKKEDDGDQDSSTTTRTTSTATTTTPSATSSTADTTSELSTGTATQSESSRPTSTSDASEDTNNSSSQDGGPDVTAIVGGVVGACGLLVIVAVILFVYVRRNAQRNRNRKPSPTSNKPAMAPTSAAAAPSFRGGHSRQPSNMSTAQAISTRFISYPRRDSFEDIPIGTPREAPRVEGLGLVGRSVSGRSLTNTYHDRRRPDSIPNAFANGSPNPSISGTLPRTPSSASAAHVPVRTGTVSSAKLAPIRSMRSTASRHLHPETARHIMLTTPNLSTESINVFTDPRFVVQDSAGEERRTRFSDLMQQADLEGVGSDRTYVPTMRTPKRI